LSENYLLHQAKDYITYIQACADLYNKKVIWGTWSKDTYALLENLEIDTIKFNAETTTSTGGGGSSIGNYDLTSSYQDVYTKTGSGSYSGVYAGNLYTVKARSDIPTRIIFRIDFNDVVVDNNIDNNVDGRLESTLQHLRADGDVTVVAPTYFNNQALA
jgi:hypothetical protein